MLPEILFFVLGIYLIVYAVLDGFDLGGAFISPFLGRTDRERRVILNAIGRVWDGNEVWLITFGAFLFGVFPAAYARFFSAAYIPVILLALVLVIRAVGFEFRSQYESKAWRSFWDWLLSISSLLIMAVLAAAAANVTKGVEMTDGPFRLHLFEALNPFALVSAVTVISIFTLHGLLYIANKSEGELYRRAISFSKIFWASSIVFFFVWVVFTAIFESQVLRNFVEKPLFTVVPVITLVSIVLIIHYIRKEDLRRAFTLSSFGVGGLVASFGLTLYPNLVRSAVDEKYNITVHNAASSELTMTVVLAFALLGLILAPTYQMFVYRTFAGKVKEEDIHY